MVFLLVHAIGHYMCTTGMYTLLFSMSIGYNNILNKKEKKKFDHYACSVSSFGRLDGFHNRAAVGVSLASVLPENSSGSDGT